MRKVIITGMGTINPLGKTVRESWESAISGCSGVDLISNPDGDSLNTSLVGEVKDFKPELFLDRKEVKRTDRFQQLARAAATEAISESGLVIDDENSDRIGVIISTSSGGYQTLENELQTINNKGRGRVSPFAIAKIMPNGASAYVAMAIGATGPSAAICSACASSSDAIGYGMDLIRSGRCDAVIVGGAEASIHTVSLASFSKMKLLTSRDSNTPSPFCRKRDGIAISEGAAVLVLESIEHATKRNAHCIAEIAGYGSGNDSHHITTPHMEGKGAVKTIKQALADAKLEPSDIDYINAHGTGTKINDLSETNALKIAFRHDAYKTPVSSTKSMTGHLMGASSALELIFTVCSIVDSVLVPTINYTEFDPECDLDFVPNEARESLVRCAMTNAFGFGGHNSVLIAKSV